MIVSVALFIILFRRIHRYYERVAESSVSAPSLPRRTRDESVVIVPVTNVSLLTARALSEALSLCLTWWR